MRFGTFVFRPYLLNGTPIQMDSQIGFHFHLKGKRDNGKGRSGIRSCPQSRIVRKFRTIMNATGAFTLLAAPNLLALSHNYRRKWVVRLGLFYLTVVIGADGKVQDVKVISGDSQFVDPVVAAVKQFVYEPEMVGGKPAVATIEASYHFGPRQ